MDAIVHNGPEAPVVRLRWVYTEQPFLPIGTNNVINNRVWNEDQDSLLAVGQLPLIEADYRQDARWTLAPLLPADHMCHPEWFSVGEPWPNNLPRTVRDNDGTPQCCRAFMLAEFQAGFMDPVNGEPASQLRQFAIDADAADADTPFQQLTVGDALGGAAPNIRGFSCSYNPLGTNGAVGWSYTVLADAAGVMLSHVEAFTVDASNGHTRTVNAAGVTEALEVGGVATEQTLRVLGGVGVLGGNNLKIDAALFPNGAEPRTFQALAAAGTTQGTAGAITGTNVVVSTNPPANSGVRLPAAFLGPIYISFRWATTFNAVKIYPHVGGSLNLTMVDAPITITPSGVPEIQLWCAVPLNVTPTGGDWRVWREM